MPLLKNNYVLPPEIAKALRDAPAQLYSIEPPPRRLPIRELSTVWFAQKAAHDTWKRYNGTFGSPTWAPLRDSKPKWGQPGRRRRQKARLQARRRNEAKQKAISDLEAFAKKIRDRQREELRQHDERIARAVFDRFSNPPKGPLFE